MVTVVECVCETLAHQGGCGFASNIPVAGKRRHQVHRVLVESCPIAMPADGELPGHPQLESLGHQDSAGLRKQVVELLNLLQGPAICAGDKEHLPCIDGAVG